MQFLNFVRARRGGIPKRPPPSFSSDLQTKYQAKISEKSTSDQNAPKNEFQNFINANRLEDVQRTTIQKKHRKSQNIC